MNNPLHLHIFISIVDNYGDMGTACELILALQYSYNTPLNYTLWVDDREKMLLFLEKSGLPDMQIQERKQLPIDGSIALALCILHAPLPEKESCSFNCLILRIDYLAFDPHWIQHNETLHIQSTPKREIREIIPSPLSIGAGLVPPLSGDRIDPSWEILCNQPHIIIFLYHDTFSRVDWHSFPQYIRIFVCGDQHQFSDIDFPSSITFLGFVPLMRFYQLLDTSLWAIIRGDTTCAHIIQSGVPFFWDIYRGLGGFDEIQNQCFLDFLHATSDYREIHMSLNGATRETGIPDKITYEQFHTALQKNTLQQQKPTNLIDTLKKHIDRFQKSI